MSLRSLPNRRRGFAVLAATAFAAPVAIALVAPVALAAPASGSKGSQALQPPAAADDSNKIAQPFAVFSGLDKITGRIIGFDVAIDETVQFGALQVTPRVCYSRPPTVAPLTTSFVEVDEITLDNKIRRIFTGWMFADSPGLHAVEHAVYDVWLVDCKGASTEAAPKKADKPAPEKPASTTPEKPASTAPAAPPSMPPAAAPTPPMR